MNELIERTIEQEEYVLHLEEEEDLRNDFDINSYGRNGKGYTRRMDEAGCYFHPNS